jgi:serine protease AprX
MLSLHQRMGASKQYVGRGVVMAFIDSGFYPHPDLAGRILTHVDATTQKVIEGPHFFYPRDYSWHGQMTSVIAAGDGRTPNGRASGFPGLAPAAQLVLIKVTSPHGKIKESDIARGMRWLLANHQRYRVRVLNISVGGDYESQDPNHELHAAVRQLVAEGVSVTIAAGNNGGNFFVPPASAAEAITVGGYDDQNTLDTDQWRGYNNNFGTIYDGTAKPEVIGPASWLPSPILPGSTMMHEARWLALMLKASDQQTVNQLLITAFADLGIPRKMALNPDEKTYALLQERINKHKLIGPKHQHVDGTSVSSAIVAGVMAQMLEANPKLTPAEIRAILIGTAKHMNNVAPERQGAGVVDAMAAVTVAASSVKEQAS